MTPVSLSNLSPLSGFLGPSSTSSFPDSSMLVPPTRVWSVAMVSALSPTLSEAHVQHLHPGQWPLSWGSLLADTVRQGTKPFAYVLRTLVPCPSRHLSFEWHIYLLIWWDTSHFDNGCGNTKAHTYYLWLLYFHHRSQCLVVTHSRLFYFPICGKSLT